MGNQITWEDMKEAMKLIQDNNKCEKCGTQLDGYMSLGAEYPVCKCKAEELSKHPEVKRQHKLLKDFCGIHIKEPIVEVTDDKIIIKSASYSDELEFALK